MFSLNFDFYLDNGDDNEDSPEELSKFKMSLVWILTVTSSVVISILYPTIIEGNIQIDTAPIIDTCHGPVRGTILMSRSNQTYYGFMGIPYAKPPIGKLRFKPPVPPDEWQDILDAQSEGPVCLQKNYLFQNPVVEGSEDCLNINVYTPKLVNRKYASRSKLLPVLVVINWGGFFAGYGNSQYLGPEYFMDHDVVVVTFNYRLGVLGFLSTNDDASPGNWGLKDQVAALKWVRDNIERFGGHSKKVTIFGQSAGAASVHYHILSPTTKHLFRGAISSSGTALNLWAKPSNQLAPLFAGMQAKFVGCPNDRSTQDLVDCLRKVDAVKLVDSGDKFKFFSVDPLNVFSPVVEKQTFLNPCPYITKEPLEIIQKKEFQVVPWIIGVVQDEGLIRTSALIRQKETREALSNGFDVLMPNMLGLVLSVPQSATDELWDEIKQFYFRTANTTLEPLTGDKIQALTNIYTDRSFVHDIYQTALIHAARGHNSIWMYNFDYKGRDSYANPFAATQETVNFEWGVSHCDDLLYLFKTPALFKDFPAIPTDLLMSHIMVHIFVDFVTYGTPVPTGEVRGITLNWDKVPNLEGEDIIKNEYLTYLNITGPHYEDRVPIRFSMENNFYTERMKFWQSLPLFENVEGIQ